MKLSVVVSTYNRAESLRRTLASVARFADEIVVVNSGSTDNTVEVAKQYTSRVFARANNPMLNVNKNYGFTKATGDWILNLDDDEVIPEDLAQEIKRRIKKVPEDLCGFWIQRKNIIFGTWIRHGLWWPDKQLRLFKKGMGAFPQKHVHEYIEVQGKTDTLSASFVHYNYDNVYQYLQKMQVVYIPSEVAKYESANYQARWQDAIRFPLSDFLKIYFAQLGYKDGLHGLVLALLQSFYSFLIFVTLWERQKFAQQKITLSNVTSEFSQSGKEVAYWMDTARLKDTRNMITKVLIKIHRRYVSTK